MTGLANAVLQGAMVGGLYALLAAGLSLIFGVMRIVNIAHGDFIVLGSYVAFAAVSLTGMSPLLSLLVVLPLMAGLGYALQRLLLNRTLGPDILPPLLVTFGLSVIVQNLLLEAFSADSRKLQAGAIETLSIGLPGGLTLGVAPLGMFLVAVTVLGLLQLLFFRTELGRAFRAVADDRDIARLMGINQAHLFGVAMALSLALCGLAGVLMGVRGIFDPAIGPPRLLYAFEAVIIGGLGSLWGTLAGGVVLGVAQGVGAQIDPGWQILAGHLVFLAVLVARPQGLFARTAAG